MLPRFEKERLLIERSLGGKVDPDTSRSEFDLEKEISEIARFHGVPVEKIRRQVEMGKVVEREHDDLHAILFPFLPKWMTLEVFAEFIALAHEREIPDYYDRLAKMERSADK